METLIFISLLSLSCIFSAIVKPAPAPKQQTEYIDGHYYIVDEHGGAEHKADCAGDH